MKNVLAIVLASFAITAAAQGADSAEVLQMKELSGLMENSYMEIKWVDSEHFTYTLEENAGRSYYIVDSKSWKPQRMFDNKAFADSLNKISQGGADPLNLRLGFLKFDKKNPYSFTFDYKKERFRYDIKKARLTKVEPDVPVPNAKTRRARSGGWHKSFCSDSSSYISAKGHDLWLYKGQDSIRLSNDGERHFSYATSGRFDELSEDKKGGAIGQWVGKS